MTTTRPIVAETLGREVRDLLERDSRQLLRTLRRIDSDEWPLKTGFRAMAVAELIPHLTEGADRLASALEEREAQVDETLFPSADESPEWEPQQDEDEMSLAGEYRRSMQRLHRALRHFPGQEWSSLSATPDEELAETFAERARRWLAHHYVHRMDIHEILGRPTDRHEATVGMVVESVWDALVRRGAELVAPSIAFKAIIAPPGSGVWTMRLAGADFEPGDDLPVWQDLLAWKPEGPPANRLERGAGQGVRVAIRSDGEHVWRAAFARGGGWDELQLNGDNEALSIWHDITESLGLPRDEVHSGESVLVAN